MFRACKPSDQTGRSSRRNAPDLHHHRRLALMQADMSLWHMGFGLLQQFHPHSTLHLRHRRMIALGEAGTLRAGRLFGLFAPGLRRNIQGKHHHKMFDPNWADRFQQHKRSGLLGLALAQNALDRH